MKKTFVIFTALLLILTAVVVPGCALLGVGGNTKSQTDGFAIYLPEQNLTASQMNQTSLDKIKIQDTPLISQGDIISYERGTHIIHLATPALTSVYNQTLKAPSTGVVFIACVDRQPVYWGLIWTTRLTATPPDGKVIITVYQTIDNAVSSTSVPAFIQLSYSGSDDPRSNPAIFDALAKADKLK